MSWTIVVFAVLVAVAFYAGVLFGRANPNKATKMKEYADKMEKEAQNAVQKAKDGLK